METHASDGHAAVLETTFASDQTGSGPHPIKRGEMESRLEGRTNAEACWREFGAVPVTENVGLETGTTKPLTAERVLNASTMNVTVLFMLRLWEQKRLQ